MSAHNIDCRIYEEEMQYVEIALNLQEIVVNVTSSFLMMHHHIKMTTILGDGSNQEKGILSKIIFC
jgi:uncharacterized protein (AIM24 family)